MNATEKTTEISRAPKARPALTEDGVAIGFLITLHDATAIDAVGKLVNVPRGSLITQAISGGFDGRVNAVTVTHKLVSSGTEITFLS